MRKSKYPILQRIYEDDLSKAQFIAQNRLCNGREKLIEQVMTTGRWQGVLVYSLLILLTEEVDEQQKQALIEMLTWIKSTLDYFSEKIEAIMLAKNPAQVEAVTWDWDIFLKTYPGHTLWDLTISKPDKYLLPPIGIKEHVE